MRKQMSEGPGVMEKAAARSVGDTFKFKHYKDKTSGGYSLWAVILGSLLKLLSLVSSLQ